MEKNQGKKPHKRALDYLSTHPDLFFLEKRDISAVCSELKIFSRGRQYGEIDLVYFLYPAEKGVVVVEYKSTHSTNSRSRGKVQVERAMNHYLRGGIPVKGYLLEGIVPFVNGHAQNRKREKKYCTTQVIIPQK